MWPEQGRASLLTVCCLSLPVAQHGHGPVCLQPSLKRSAAFGLGAEAGEAHGGWKRSLSLPVLGTGKGQRLSVSMEPIGTWKQTHRHDLSGRTEERWSHRHREESKVASAGTGLGAGPPGSKPWGPLH
jgi:hypothetical protein